MFGAPTYSGQASGGIVGYKLAPSSWNLDTMRTVSLPISDLVLSNPRGYLPDPSSGTTTKHVVREETTFSATPHTLTSRLMAEIQ
jgi:hypothetical protein